MPRRLALNHLRSLSFMCHQKGEFYIIKLAPYLDIGHVDTAYSRVVSRVPTISRQHVILHVPYIILFLIYY